MKKKAKKRIKPNVKTKGKSKAKREVKPEKTKNPAKPKAQNKSKAPKTKARPTGVFLLKTLAAEIERISLRLDTIEKDVRNLKGVAYPIG